MSRRWHTLTVVCVGIATWWRSWLAPNAPEKAQLDVTVSTVEDTRRRLLAFVEREQAALPVVDAETVEVIQR